MSSVPYIWVRGAGDTSKLKCEVCGGWFNHWKNLSNFNENAIINCCHPDHKTNGEKKSADRGAHVVKHKMPNNNDEVELSQTDISDITSGKMYIIPVCDEHNITEEKLILIPKKLLIDAEPCDKKINNKSIRFGLRL